MAAPQILNVILVFVFNFVHEIHVLLRVYVCPFHPLTASCYQAALQSLFGTLFSNKFTELAAAFNAFILSRIKINTN